MTLAPGFVEPRRSSLDTVRGNPPLTYRLVVEPRRRPHYSATHHHPQKHLFSLLTLTHLTARTVHLAVNSYGAENNESDFSLG